MNKYELTLVVSAKIDEEARTAVVDKVKSYIEKANATITDVNECGFKKTGIFRKACYKNGRFIDAHHFEIVTDEKLVGNKDL